MAHGLPFSEALGVLIKYRFMNPNLCVEDTWQNHYMLSKHSRCFSFMPNFKNYFCKTELTLYQKSLNRSFLFFEKKIRLPKLFGIQMKTRKQKAKFLSNKLNKNLGIVPRQIWGVGPRNLKNRGGGSQQSENPR